MDQIRLQQTKESSSTFKTNITSTKNKQTKIITEIKVKIKIYLKSPIIIITKKAIIPRIVLSQKISYNRSNLYIGNYYFKNK